MGPTQISKTSAFNTQTPGKYPKDNLSLLQNGESLKTRKITLVIQVFFIFTHVTNFNKKGIQIVNSSIPSHDLEANSMF
jgi:hypothetical protein